jgi:hypothetical protein
VETTTVSSAPNALAVTVDGGGNAYAYKQYSTGYTTHTLTFSLQLGSDFTVPHLNYLVLAQTVPLTSSKVGKADVTIPADNRIRLDYFDSAGQQHYLWGRFVVPKGSLALLVDGTTVASGSNLDLGTKGLTWFAVGEEHAPGNSGIAGHLYIDNVTATATT